MSQWVRLWEDMPNDPKWRVVARRANASCVSHALHCVTIRDVVSVFVHMLICAGNAKNRGTLEGWNDEVAAVALDAEVELIIAIREAMEGLVLDDNRLKSWEKRQPNREDSSTERVRALRSKRNAGERMGTQLERSVTHVKRTWNAPEEKREDTDTDLKKEKPLVFPKKTNQKIWISENEGPNEQQIADSEKFGLNETEAINVEFEKFRDHHLANGTQFADWNAAWRRWLEKGRGNKTAAPKRVTTVSVANGNPTQMFFAERGTPQWNAWEDFYLKSKGSPPPHDIRRGTSQDGWFFPTEWPPAILTDA
jgi:hypothetical protein